MKLINVSHNNFLKWCDYFLWGSIIYGSNPFTCGESTGPSRGGLWLKPGNIKHKIASGYSRGQFSPR